MGTGSCLFHLCAALFRHLPRTLGFDLQAAYIQLPGDIIPDAGCLLELPHLAPAEGHRIHRVHEFLIQEDGLLLADAVPPWPMRQRSRIFCRMLR